MHGSNWVRIAVTVSMLTAGLVTAPAVAASAAQQPAGQVPPSVNDRAAKPAGVAVKKLKATANAHAISLTVSADKALLKPASKSQRLRIRMLAMPSENRAPQVLWESDQKLAKHTQQVRARLPKKATKSARQAAKVVVSVTQVHQGRKAKSKKFDSAFVSTSYLTHNSKGKLVATVTNSGGCQRVLIAKGANLAACDFTGADLRGTLITKSNLTSTKFFGSQLAGASFTGSDVGMADFRFAKKANLKGSISTPRPTDFTPVPRPSFAAISPAKGEISGGYDVTITGSGFVAGSAVKIGTGDCTNMKVADDGKSLTCTAPAGGFGAADVTVINGAVRDSLTSGFTYGKTNPFFWQSGPHFPTTKPATIGRANIDGADQQAQLIGGLDTDIQQLATDGERIWFANSTDAIGYMNTDGSGVNYSFITGNKQVVSLAVDDSAIYWIDRRSGSSKDTMNLMSSPKDVSNPTVVATMPSKYSFFKNLIQDDRYLYWLSSRATDSANTAVISRAPKNDLGSVKWEYSKNNEWRQSLAIAQGNFYWLDANGRGLEYLPVDAPNTDPQRIALERIRQDAISSNGQFLYLWVMSTQGVSMDLFDSGSRKVVKSFGLPSIDTNSLPIAHLDGSPPIVSKVQPDSAVMTDHTQLTIKGRYFRGHQGAAPSVTVGGRGCLEPKLVDPNTLTCTLTGTSNPGPADIVVTNSDLTSVTVSGQFTYTVPAKGPVATWVEPAYGPVEQPNDLTIKGYNLNAGTDVKVGDQPCATTSFSGSQLTCTVERATPGTADVAVSGAGQTQTLASGFTFTKRPSFATDNPVTPQVLPVKVSNEIHITGSDFVVNDPSGQTASVRVGGRDCAVKAGLSDASTLVCVTDRTFDRVGTADVVVTNPDGGTRTLADAVQFKTVPVPRPQINGISPMLGDTDGGYYLTISGSGFLPRTTVRVGNSTCTNPQAAVDGSQISCIVPSSTRGSADVVVDNGDWSTTLSNGFTYGKTSQIFWKSVKSIGRSNLDGTKSQPRLFPDLPDGPLKLALDKDRVWFSYHDGALGWSRAISYVNQDGSGTAHELITFPDDAYVTGLAVDDSQVYWLQGSKTTNTMALMASSKTVNSPTTLATMPSQYCSVTNLTSDGEYLYWLTNKCGSPTDNTVISRMAMDGTSPVQWEYSSVERARKNWMFSQNLAVAQGKIYWITPDGRGLYWLPVDNPNADPQSVQFDQPMLPEVGTNGQYIYLSSQQGSDPITVSMFDIAAGKVVKTFTSDSASKADLGITGPNTMPPVVTNVSPSSAPVGVSTVLTISGRGFRGYQGVAPAVTVGGRACANPTLVNANTLTCTVDGGGSEGPADVIVINSDLNNVVVADKFSYTVPATGPIATSVDAPSGPVGQPIEVRVKGYNLYDGTQVTIGGQNCAATNFEGWELTCTVQGTTPGLADVAVTGYGQTKTLTNGFRFTAQPAFDPQTPVAPNLIQANASSVIRINGSNFIVNDLWGHSSRVTVGGRDCPVDPGQSTTSSLVCSTDARYDQVGLADIMVTNPDGGTKTLSNAIRYVGTLLEIGSVSPAAAYVVDGDDTRITVNGKGFEQGASVFIVNTDYPCTDVQVTPDGQSLTCTPPANRPGDADVIVHDPDTQQATKIAGFRYLPAPPTITGITPDHGSTGGGQRVTISGTNFISGSTVGIGAVACSDPVVESATALTCTTGAHGLGQANVVLLSPDGRKATAANLYQYEIPTPTIDSITPASGSVNGGQAVTLHGTGFLGTSTVTIGGQACARFTVTQADGSAGTCTTPGHSYGSADVTVANNDLQATLPGGYAYGGTNLYWNSSASQIGRMSADGSSQNSNFVGGLNEVRAVAVDGQKVWFINDGTKSIGSVDLNGANLNKTVIQNVGNATAIAVDDDKVYWVDHGDPDSNPAKIFAASKTQPESRTTIAQFTYSYEKPTGIALDDQYVYWANDDMGGTIGRALKSDPSQVNPRFVPVSAAEDPRGILVSNGNLYWANSNVVHPGRVGWVPISNPSAQVQYVNIPNQPDMMASNGKSLYTTLQDRYGEFTVMDLSTTALSTIEIGTGAGTTLAADQVYPAPTVTSVSPANGSRDGGTQLTINGTGFRSMTDPHLAPSVTVGGVGCSALNVISETQLTCTTGARAGGTVDVVLTNYDLTSVTAAGAFTYSNPAPTIAAVAPASGAIGGGYRATITGTNLLPGTTIRFGANNCPVVYYATDGLSASCTVPAGQQGAVDVVVQGVGTTSATLPSGFSYLSGGTLFWANNGAPASSSSCQPGQAEYGTIGRSSSLPNTSINQCQVFDVNGEHLFSPSGVATDGTYLYWADSGLAIIGRSKLDGTDVRTLIDLSGYPNTNPTGVAVAGDYLYWSNGGLRGQHGSIGRAKLDGTGIGPVWISTDYDGGSSPMGVTIHNDKVYWADNAHGTIGTADLSDPGNPNRELVHTTANPTGVAVDDNYIYWSNNPGSGSAAIGSIGRAPIGSPDGPVPNWIPNVVAPTGVALDGSHIYWTAPGVGAGGVIGRADIDGSNPLPDFKTGAQTPIGVTYLGG